MFSRSPFLCGDSLSLMECMDNDCYHAVVTDPPYASGGLTTAERKASPPGNTCLPQGIFLF